MKVSEIKNLDTHEISDLCQEIGYSSAKSYLNGPTIEASRWEDQVDVVVADLKAEIKQMEEEANA